MNFSFEVDDIVIIKGYGDTRFVLIKGFDPIPSGHRIWWADPFDGVRTNSNKRLRTYSNQMTRVSRPKEEEALRVRAEDFKMRKAAVKSRKRALESEAELRSLRKKGNFCLQTGPINIPPGKWLSPEGIEAIRQALKIKPRK